MLKLTALEFLVRTIPEACIYIFAGYIFSNTRLNVIRYLITSMILAICTFSIRLLPINYGVHTILITIIMILLLTIIAKIDTILAIKASIISTICLFIIELLNLLALNLIFKEQLVTIMLNSIKKIMYGFPSLIGFAIIVLCYYLFKKKDKKKHDKA